LRKSRFRGKTRCMARKMTLSLLAAYWRLKRGATLGAQGVVFDNENQVLLIRHSYRPGWHFPGGGVEWRETAETAMTREVFEEAGVIVKGRPQFHGLFANNLSWLPSDHIAVFIVREWERPFVPPPNREILESRFFARDALPDGVIPAVQRRLAEILDGKPLEPHW
jgi:8-oxo-dGTP pyrophosphatase MutT (NUDIX family)